MPLYDNEICPVCKREFETGDDVVFCPDCGTPHHRECYNLVGHCVNQGLHKSDYSYFEEHPRKPKTEEPSSDSAQEQSRPFNPFFAPAETQSNGSQGAQQPFGAFEFKTGFENDGEMLDGESTADIACVVRTNTQRFIPKFKALERKKSAAGWNWAALIFGPYYLFFRKMYSHGILFLALLTGINSAGGYAIERLAPEFTRMLNDMVTAVYSMDASSLDINSLMSASDYDTALKLSFIITAISVVVRIIIAMYADSFYMSCASRTVKNVREKLNDGAQFAQSPFSMQEADLSQEQMKRIYLSRRGGTSIFSPLLAYLALYIINSIISKL